MAAAENGGNASASSHLYVEVNRTWAAVKSADCARTDGRNATERIIVMGIRLWFSVYFRKDILSAAYQIWQPIFDEGDMKKILFIETAAALLGIAGAPSAQP